MAGDINVKLRADASGFTKGTDDAVKAIKEFEDAVESGAENASEKLEDAIKAVVDLGKQTSKSGDEIKEALQGLGLSAQDAEDAFNAIEREAEGAGDATSDVGDKASNATEGFRSLGDIAKDVLSGDISSAAEGAADALGNLLGNIPGIGAVAAAAAAGVGLIGEELKKNAEASAEARDSIIADFVQIGDAMQAEAVDARIGQWLNDEDKRKQGDLLAQLMSEHLGYTVTVGQAYLGMAGDFRAAGFSAEEMGDAIQAAPGDVDFAVWQGLQSTVQGVADGMEIGAQAAAARADAMDRAARADLQAAIATGEVTKEVDELNNSLYTLPDGRQIMIDAETGQATTDVSNFKGDLDGVPDVVKSTVRVDVDSSAWDRWTPKMKTALIAYSAVAADKRLLQ